jgi:hypothetical protein
MTNTSISFSLLAKKYLIDSQFYVSLMGTLFASFFMLEQGTFLFPTFFLLLITYFSGYIYTEFQFSASIKTLMLINCIAGIICVYLIFKHHHADRILKLGIISILGLLYDSSFLKGGIRRIPFVKVFYVGLVWGLMNAWLTFDTFNWPIFIISFFYITALVLPFDIRDMESDRGIVLTIPHAFGIRATKFLAYFLTSIALIVSYFYLKPIFFIAFALTYSVTYVLIYFSKPTNTDFYFSFWVESCSGLPIFFLGLINLFF